MWLIGRDDGWRPPRSAGDYRLQGENARLPGQRGRRLRSGTCVGMRPKLDPSRAPGIRRDDGPDLRETRNGGAGLPDAARRRRPYGQSDHDTTTLARLPPAPCPRRRRRRRRDRGGPRPARARRRSRRDRDCSPPATTSWSGHPRSSPRSAARAPRGCRWAASRSSGSPVAMGRSAPWTPSATGPHHRGRALGYDRLIVATGARAVEGVPGATTFRGPLSAGAVEGALRRARERVLFTLPAGAGWTLPLYELALLAAHELPDGPELTIVTPEPRPLDLFGPVASDALARLLDRAGIGFEGETVAEAVVGGALATRDGRLIAADAVIALARLQGPRIAGLPADADGLHRRRRARPRHRRARRLRRRRRDGRADQAGRPRRPAGRRRRRGDRRRGRRPRHAPCLPPRAARRRLHRRGAAVPAPRPRRRQPARPPAPRRARGHLALPALVAVRQDRRPLSDGLPRGRRRARRHAFRPAPPAGPRSPTTEGPP